MVNKALLAAMKTEDKAFYAEQKSKVLVDYILQNYYLFTQEKGNVYNCLKGQPHIDAGSLLEMMNLPSVGCYKMSKEEVTALAVHGAKSELFKQFLAFCSKHKGSGTVFFVLGKTLAIVITNQYTLEPGGNFKHVLTSVKGHAPAYWANVADVKDTLRLY